MDVPVLSTSLESWRFDNRVTESLPADPSAANHTRQVPGACFTRVKPRRVRAPEVVAVSDEMLALLDASPEVARAELFAEVFAGNRLLDGMDPYAWCYGGHQFGNWAGQLGDGRAINLGEVVNRVGEHWALQLKGAGATPYSRMADGLAVLRSSIREFLCSEAMHHLGVPTTRALSLVATGETVVRDMFYDGHPREEPGAVVCRVAPSFIRFGNFEIHAARRETDILRKLADFTIRTGFPHLDDPVGADAKSVYREWFEEVCRRTADLIVDWMRVGFVHGVMNTDNMSILGLTIDYGPYGWLEDYNPGWTPNTTDAAGRRYCFGNQPAIALWNLNQLANALYPLFEDAAPLRDALEGYAEYYNRRWREMMAAKLGLARFEEETDEELVAALLDVLQAVETDVTIFFRRLAELDARSAFRDDPDAAPRLLGDAFYRAEQVDSAYLARLSAWLEEYARRLDRDGVDDAARRRAMNAVNPKYVLRNYLAQLAIDRAEEGDYDEVQKLLEVMRRPYDEQPRHSVYAEKRPEWARHRAGCSMLSCSS